MSGVFSNIGGLRPPRNAFNLSHSNLFDCGFGKLIPAFCMEMVPGDTFKMDISCVGRLTSALNSPILASMDIVFEAFFVPTRILMGSDANFPTPSGEGNWETFLSGGRTGTEVVVLPTVNTSNSTISRGGISDYIGIQVGTTIAEEDRPLAFPWRMYRFIWNEYYRNENFTDPIQVCQTALNGQTISFSDYDSLLSRGWKADYFTSALPEQQRGISPAFTIEGQLPVQYTTPSTVPVSFTGLVQPTSTATGYESYSVDNSSYNIPSITSTSGGATLSVPSTTVRPKAGFYSTYSAAQKSVPDYTLTGSVSGVTGQSADFSLSGTSSNTVNAGLVGYDDEGNNTNFSTRVNVSSSVSVNSAGFVDLKDAVTFDIKEVRQAFQIQKWLERNMRAGYRYTEYLQSHFGVSPSDGRLQRPYFIGGCRIPWLINEVVQTSSTDGTSPQGNQAGQAVSFGHSKLGNFHADEFGYLMILCSVVPKPSYQDGIPRYLSRKSKFDFYTPEFAHLSEQAVLNKEIFYTEGNTELNNGIFGYQGIFNEMRFLPSRVSNHMRSLNSNDDGEYSFDYWHLARHFEELPVLNTDFLTIDGNANSSNQLMRIFADQADNPFIIHAGLKCTAIRPMPRLAEPGLVDHF